MNTDKLDFLTELANMNICKEEFEVSTGYLKEFIAVQSKLHSESISSQEVFSEELSEARLFNLEKENETALNDVNSQKENLLYGFIGSSGVVLILVFLLLFKKKKPEEEEDDISLILGE